MDGPGFFLVVPNDRTRSNRHKLEHGDLGSGKGRCSTGSDIYKLGRMSQGREALAVVKMRWWDAGS